MALSNSIILSSSGASLRNVDRVFEDAQLKGELKLNSRKLKEFPKIACKYDLSDVLTIDLSKNRFSEVPEEICSCGLLEDLDCYNNVIRSIPDAVIHLQSLISLNLSRNQLTIVPVSVCQLPLLQVLNLQNNRLVSIPEEIIHMKCLRDLDVSCNEITIVPPQLGGVSTLQRLNIKRNLLLEIPIDLCQLRLIYLDISANRISAIPTQLRIMTSLQDLIVDQNPLTFPPAVLCKRGKVHIFKFLEIQALKEDKRGIVLETEFQKYRSPSILSDSRLHNGFTSAGCCRKSYTFDSGYSTSDGDCRSQESQELNFGKKLLGESSRWEMGGNLRNHNAHPLFHSVNGDEGNKLIEDPSFGDHPQTFREYKEALKKKRDAEILNIYKRTPNDENGLELSPKLQVSKTKSAIASRHALRKEDSTSSNINDSVRIKEDILVSEAFNENAPKLNHKIENFGEKLSLSEKKALSQKEKQFLPLTDEMHHNSTWPKNSISFAPKPLESSFTMRREFDKAREERVLISQLREILEGRLKLKLPDDMESALNDGVFLCHLANNIRNNSVTCIHVPSPAVPKLTIAKCRRNADNFLEACRRIGVPNAELLAWAESFLALESLQTKDMPFVATPRALPYILLAVFISTAYFLYLFPDAND